MIKSLLKKIGFYKDKKVVPAVAESPVRSENPREAQVAAPVEQPVAESKVEEPTKVMVDRLVEVAEKKEEVKVTAKDIKAKSKNNQKSEKPVQKQNPNQSKKPNPNQKQNQAKKPNPNQKPQAKKPNPNQKPAPKKG